jgi:hypothetical protein
MIRTPDANLAQPEIRPQSSSLQAESDQSSKYFFFLVLAVFAILSLVIHPQVLRSKVPLAVDVVTNFPPWHAVRGEPKTPHAEVGDSLTLFYPWRVFQEFALHRKELPLWNPRILGGTPFLANAQSALFYPIHLLLLIQRPATLWTVKLLLNLMLSGVFTAMFVRSIGGSPMGSIASGILFSCCGFLAAWQTFTSLADAAIWLPFILWSLHRLCLRPAIPAMAVSAAAFAMPVLAGHPETAAHLTVAGCGYALWQCVAYGRKDHSILRRLCWVAAAGMLGIGISAVQIIPTLEWLGQIDHGLDERWPPRPVHEMLSFISRDILGDPNSAGLTIPESAAYIAPMALLLASVAFSSRNRRYFSFFLLLVILSLAIIQGWQPVQWLVEQTPILSGIRNGRLLLVVDFGVAVLAGLGLTSLCEESPARLSLRRYRWISLLVTFIAVGIGVAVLSSSTHAPIGRLRGPESSAVFLALGFIVIAARLANLISPRTFVVLALSVLSFDMLTFRSGILPFASRKEIFPPVATFQFLKANADPAVYRVGSIGDTYLSNAEMVYGLDAVDGYDLELRLAQNFLTDFGFPTTGLNLSAEHIVGLTDRRLDLMNLRYLVATTDNNSYEVLATRPDRFKLVLADGSVRILENLRALPRALFVPALPDAIEVITKDNGQLARLKDPAFDPEKSVVLSAAPPEFGAGPVSNGSSSAPGKVSVVSAGINESVFKTVNTQPGLLIVGQVFYPGWVAIVDGKEKPVVRADYALTGVPLGEGAHTVRLVFRPVSFRIGLAISIASCALIAGLNLKRNR